METPSLQPTLPEDQVYAPLRVDTSKPAFSLARFVIVLYIAGLFAAIIAAGTPNPPDHSTGHAEESTLAADK